MTTIEKLRSEATRRRDENLVLFGAYQMTLRCLMPANLLLVVGAAILSLVAGASFLIEHEILKRECAGMLSLISAAFTVVHSKLGCEEYQGECKKLLGFHRGIASDYENLLVIEDPEDFRKRMTALDDQVSAVLKTVTALPFKRAIALSRKSS